MTREKAPKLHDCPFMSAGPQALGCCYPNSGRSSPLLIISGNAFTDKLKRCAILIHRCVQAHQVENGDEMWFGNLGLWKDLYAEPGAIPVLCGALSL